MKNYNKNLYDNFTLFELFENSVKISPQKILILNNEINITYQQALEKIEIASENLLSKGLKFNNIAIIQIQDLLEFIIAFFACLRIGAIPLLALTAHKNKELLNFINTTNSNFIITDSNFYDQNIIMYKQIINNKNDINIILINKEYSKKYNNNITDFNQIKSKISTQKTALLLVSGGTTGLNKIISRTHQDYCYNIFCAIKKCFINHDDIYLSILPVAHNFTLACPGILGCIASQAQLVYSNNSSPEYCFNLIEKYKVTFTSIVPSIANIWTKSIKWENFNLNSLRFIQVGGSRFAPIQAKEFDESFNYKLQQVYGMAEGLVCFTNLNDPRKIVWFTQGSPMSEYDQIKVIDENGEQMSIGCNGQLITKGPYTITSYFNAPNHVNKKNFTDDGFYITGDKVKLLKNNTIIVTGRIKDTIIRAGEKIDCTEIEEIAIKHNNIKEAVLIAKKDSLLGEKTCLAIVPTNNKEIPNYDEIRDFFINQKIANFKIPDEISIQYKLPKTAIGKLDRKKLTLSLNDNLSN